MAGVPIWLIIVFVVIIVVATVVIIILALFTNTFAIKSSEEVPVGLGGTCKTSNGCTEGLRCDAGICLAETGTTCTADNQCHRGALCDTTCKSKFDNVCSTDDDCITGLSCNGSVCKKSTGQACLSDLECVFDCSNNGVCAAGVLESCTGNNTIELQPCARGLICTMTDNTCRVIRGGSCNTNAECYDHFDESNVFLPNGKNYECVNSVCQGVLNTYCPNGDIDCGRGLECYIFEECKLTSGHICNIDSDCHSFVCTNGVCL